MDKLMWVIFVVAMLGMAAGVVAIGWNEWSGQQEIALLQAESDAANARAEELNAQAAADDAAAELERAQGERIFKEYEGRAIFLPSEAAARAVDQNTDIVGAMGKTNTLYDRLLPLAGLLFMVVLVMAGTALGIMGTAVFLYLRGKKKNDALKLEAVPSGISVDLS